MWAEILPGLRKAGVDQAELYVKRGRSRSYERRRPSTHSRLSHEVGWAVRGGGTDGSFQLAGTGEPASPRSWPRPSGPPTELPRGRRVPSWKATSDLDAPLISEVEAGAMLTGLEERVRREIGHARLSHALLEDGASESGVFSSRGVEAAWRARSASLYVEVTTPGLPALRMLVAESEARQIQIPALASRLVDRLSVVSDGARISGGGGQLVLHPQVGVRLLAGLLPFLIGTAARDRATAMTGPDGLFASELVSVIDNGRYAGGVLDAPVDGEGVATEELVLVEEGRYRQPLVDWRGAAGGSERGVGCNRRSGWREWPAVGPTHLFLAPNRQVRPGELLGSVDRGHYLLDVLEGGWFDPGSDRFSLPVCGFTLRSGEARSALAHARWTGGLGDLLRSITGVARDLSFFPRYGMLGVPTLALSGQELS